jgi:hypothetical protein
MSSGPTWPDGARVVQQLLHQPTVRVRELAATADGDQYVAVLRELFDLPCRGSKRPRRASSRSTRAERAQEHSS